ncbi:DUF2147 domain-containing protein [Rhodobacteraceae bacterium NNCM2]|nr:DUF2147 domain-containing protein [Coraliihabitans acroporae]
MRSLIFASLMIAAPTVLLAGPADGVWKTEANDKGGYLYVTIGACANDASKTCGTITKAFKASGEDPKYKYLGKPIIADMKASGTDSYSGGTVWDPEDNETYSSTMKVKGDVLDVEGCVTIICSGQDWTRVR